MRRPHKFENILLVELTLLSKRQIWEEDFFSNVVVFSQYLNFNLKLLSNNNFTYHDNHFDIILTLDMMFFQMHILGPKLMYVLDF